MRVPGRLVVGIPKNAAESKHNRVVGVHAATTQSASGWVSRDMETLRGSLCERHTQTPGEPSEELWVGDGVLMKEGGEPDAVAWASCAAKTGRSALRE